MRKITTITMAVILAVQGVLAVPVFAAEHDVEPPAATEEVTSDEPTADAAESDQAANDSESVTTVTGDIQFVDVQTGVVVVGDEVYLFDDTTDLEQFGVGDLVQFQAVASDDGDLMASEIAAATEDSGEEDSTEANGDGKDDSGDDADGEGGDAEDEEDEGTDRRRERRRRRRRG